jgi:hypothetical protein
MTTQSDEDKMTLAVSTCLDKDPTGKRIQLDWNAFDASTAITEPVLKDIHTRLLSEYDYAAIKVGLRATVFKKRCEILSMAKDKVFIRVLKECQVLQLATESGDTVCSKMLLKKWLKEARSSNSDFSRITDIAFRDCPRWKEDMAIDLSDLFGIEYDPKTVNPHSNNKGNGFMEKLCTKALNNVRMDLRAIRDRSNPCGPAPRIKRSNDEAYGRDGKYKRKKHDVSNFLCVGYVQHCAYNFPFFFCFPFRIGSQHQHAKNLRTTTTKSSNPRKKCPSHLPSLFEGNPNTPLSPKRFQWKNLFVFINGWQVGKFRWMLPTNEIS